MCTCVAQTCCIKPSNIQTVVIDPYCPPVIFIYQSPQPNIRQLNFQQNRFENLKLATQHVIPLHLQLDLNLALSFILPSHLYLNTLELI